MAKKTVILAVCGVLLLAGLGLVLLLKPESRSQPQAVWIVEDRYADAWQKTLEGGDSPLPGAKIVPLSSMGDIPEQWYGYRIGSVREDWDPPADEASPMGGGPIRVYRGLANSRQDGPAMVLAVDPWLVFRRFTIPPLNRDMVENGPGDRGRIFMAGSDQAAVWAWSAQLLQEAPGIFPADPEIWEQTAERLYSNRRFQNGARTYSWGELWPHLLDENETVWVYAPLSRIRQLPLYETNGLEANPFPGRPGWNQFGIQAEILWAAPFGSEKNRENLELAEAWLKSAELQSLLADTLGCLAAHPQAPPYNPVSHNARVIWFAASYVWEAGEFAR